MIRNLLGGHKPLPINGQPIRVVSAGGKGSLIYARRHDCTLRNSAKQKFARLQGDLFIHSNRTPINYLERERLFDGRSARGVDDY